MVFVLPHDRVLERSTSNSQTVFTVTGALDTSFNRFSASMSVGDTTIGGVVERGVAFKSGVLTYSNTNEVTVTTTNESKGTFSSGGIKEVFMGMPASEAGLGPALAPNVLNINGGVEVSQELGATVATLATTTAKYIADMWESQYIHGAATAVLTSQQLAAASFPGTAPAGYPFGLQLKATTALSSPANGDYALVRTQIEGYRIARLGWGTANAQPIGYALQFYSTVSGVAFIKFSNSTKARCFYKEITVAAGWNSFSGTITGDTSGTWQATTSAGLIVEVFSAGKAASPATPSAWGSTNTTQSTNSTNLLGTNNNLTIVTGLIILPGIELPKLARAAFIIRPFDEELKRCERYYEKSYDYATALATATRTGMVSIGVVGDGSNKFGSKINFKTTKRIAPLSYGVWDGAGTNGATTRYLNGAYGDGVSTGGTSSDASQNSFLFYANFAAANHLLVHYFADARL